jgi:hypothetical protein
MDKLTAVINGGVMVSNISYHTKPCFHGLWVLQMPAPQKLTGHANSQPLISAHGRQQTDWLNQHLLDPQHLRGVVLVLSRSYSAGLTDPTTAVVVKLQLWLSQIEQAVCNAHHAAS